MIRSLQVQGVHRETESPGFVQPGEGKAERGIYELASVIKETEPDYSWRHCKRTRGNSHKLHHGKFQLGIKKKFSPWGYTRTGDWEVVGSPCALWKPVGHLAFR